jgi:hypothetical protein
VGDGRHEGDGSYQQAAHQSRGTIHTVAGSSGKVGSFRAPYLPFVFKNLSELASVVVDIDRRRLDDRQPDAGRDRGYGSRQLRGVLADVITMPKYFSENSYTTACSGKFHNSCTVGKITDPIKPTKCGHGADALLSWSIPYNNGAGNGFKPKGHPRG